MDLNQTERVLNNSNKKVLEINDDLLYLFVKRTLDIILSSIGIVLFIPIFLILATLMKLEDPKGTIFFKQVRIGKYEKEFDMFKFRSMVSNAEELLSELKDQNEVSGPMFKIKNDPRITKIGHFLRKTSLDEIPQLFNVLKGDMSLVGPRPPLKREVVQYTEYHKQRLLAKPGCTGIWQITSRNNVGFEEMVSMDLSYMKQRNIRLDLVVILMTIKIMLLAKAY